MKKTKKILSLILAVMMLLSAVPATNLSVSAASDDGCVGGVQYYSDGYGGAFASNLCDGDHGDDGILEHTPVSGTITIPTTVRIEEYDGSYNTYEVKSIGKEAFVNTSIKNIILPDTLETIGKAAFSGAAIKSISIPKKVKSIGESAFSGCNDLVTVEIEDNIYIGRAAFNGCHNLINIDFEMMVKIGDFAFGYCESLNDVNLKNAKDIGMNAFEFSAVKNMTIGGEGSVAIGGNSFHNCTIGKLTLSENANSYNGAFFWSTQIDTVEITEDFSGNIAEIFPHSAYVSGAAIKSFSVDVNNQHYSSVDGVLFNEDKTEIIYYPIAKEDKEYTIPDSVKTIKEGAFAFCDNLEQINLPKGLECIEANAFHGCSNIKEMHIPNGVREISVGAFYFNFSLTDVYFDGTENEWEKINFSNNKGYDIESIGVFYPAVTMHFKEDAIDPPEEPEDHTHSFTSGVTVDATCTEDGVISVSCLCGYSYAEIIPAKGHKDENSDYKCDNDGCDYEFEKPAPSDPSEDCTCNCHKSGFMGFIWKILRIFYKLFKINPVCACGAAHY